MFRALIAAFALTAAPLASARAQEPAHMEAALTAMGGWTQDYMAIMARANTPFVDLSVYTTALERFSSGDASAAETRRSIEAWRATSLTILNEARLSARALREPPSFRIFGADGERLDAVLTQSHAAILPTIDEIERLVHASAELGLAALNDRAKGYEARERALYHASIQLTRVDRARIDLAAASLAPHHPTRYIAVATQHYYDSLDALPRYLLAEYDGTEDRPALVASLRASAAGIRAALTEVANRVEPLRFDARRLQIGDADAARLGRVLGQMLDTFPGTIAAYEGLAAGIDGAARAIEAGADVGDVWSGMEATERPLLEEIDRLDRLRVSLLRDISRESL